MILVRLVTGQFPMFVVTVEFVVTSGSIDAFLAEMRVNAHVSVEQEPGCARFDVCVDPADRGRVFLYELYLNQAAFHAHLESAHFKAFDNAIAPWVESKAVKKWELLDR